MSEAEIAQKTAELDRLLNDPGVRMDPHRVWALAQELMRPQGVQPTARPRAQ